MVEKGSKNPAVEMAQSLAYDDVEAALFGHQAALPPVKVDESGKAADIDPNEAIQRALARNSTGSFERFGRMTGALDQRAKML